MKINNIYLLGQKAPCLKPFLSTQGVHTLFSEDKITKEDIQSNNIDAIISYGYRHIIGEDLIQILPGRIINLHISFLPWNRGVDPNFWSFLENTKKGVSIHLIDKGIDTGPILAQQEILFDPESETLATTYLKLNNEIVQLFCSIWPNICNSDFKAKKQPHKGTFHVHKDKEKYMHLLPHGWDTPVTDIMGAASPAKIEER